MKSGKQTKKNNISKSCDNISKCTPVNKKRIKRSSLPNYENTNSCKSKNISNNRFERISSVYNSYKDILEASRIPRCSTGFDNRIPGYFNTHFGKMVYDVDKLYEHDDLKIFEYFDGHALDLRSIKKSENEIYLDQLANNKFRK
ncbi:hypothetical protein P3W45_000827 [Vairimorpha bombi]